jgi:hypothetical protein
MRQIVAFLFFALALISTSLEAQTSPSIYTSAIRYDASGRITGQISSDPDGASSLGFAAVRNTYDNVGRLVKVQQGELSAWQSHTITPLSWTGFTIFTTVDYQYNGMGSKVRETLSVGGNTQQVTQYSYDSNGRLECTAIRMNPATWGSLPASACTMTTTSAASEQDRITKNTWLQSGKIKEVRKAVERQSNRFTLATHTLRTIKSRRLLMQMVTERLTNMTVMIDLSLGVSRTRQMALCQLVVASVLFLRLTT